MYWKQGCTSKLDSEEVVLVCMLRHLENDVYRKVQGCMQASWRYIWKCRPQQGRVSTNQYLTYQLPWFCPGSGGKGTWARKESGRLFNGWIVCRCTCLAIYLVINLDSLLVLLFKTQCNFLILSRAESSQFTDVEISGRFGRIGQNKSDLKKVVPRFLEF